jgi:hypothetical protein
MQFKGAGKEKVTMAVTKQSSGWAGWAAFAGVFLVIAGILQVFDGLVALLRPTYYVVTQKGLAVLNFTSWGWIELIIGVVVLAAGFAILNGHIWGRVVGVIMAGLSLVANLMFIEAYPLWSIVIMVIDALIIYALVVHGGELADRN